MTRRVGISNWLNVGMIGALLLAASSASGHGRVPQDTPVERLVANLTQFIKEHPDDAEGYYRLGRVHTLALETKTEFVIAFDSDKFPEPAAGYWAKRESSGAKKPVIATAEQLQTHLAEAIKNLSRAIELGPREARYRLTLACALEAGESLNQYVMLWPLLPSPDFLKSPVTLETHRVDLYRERFEAIRTDTAGVDKLIDDVRAYSMAPKWRDTIIALALERRDRNEYRESIEKIRRADWHEQIEAQFFMAMCYALPSDGSATAKPVWDGMENWVSYEAGKDYVRVVTGRAARPTDQIRLRVAKEIIQAFDDLPTPNAITPMIVDLSARPLTEIVSSQSTTFDLDGSHRPQRWTWIKPDVGILVWDPQQTGRVTSGRQLFGSVSWWLFFDSGYEALDTLDDNRDGELTGDELRGISVWFDRNSNGVSDADEVIAADQLDIAAISCRATGRDGVSPMNLTGLRMKDGRVVPTIDWIATAATVVPLLVREQCAHRICTDITAP